jgi:serine/threonine protein kinase
MDSVHTSGKNPKTALPIWLHRDVAVLEEYTGTTGAGHVFSGRLVNLPALLGELMVAGEMDPGFFGLEIPFTIGRGPIEDEAHVRAIRARADALWEECRALPPDAAARARERYVRALDSRLGGEARVAVKVARRGASEGSSPRPWAQLLLREDEALRKLNHPHILRRYGRIVDPRLGMCLFLERVPGKSLERVWRRRVEQGQGPLPLAAVAHVGYQVAHALLHARGAGVSHGDLRPANLTLESPGGGTSRGLVKVAGFGAGLGTDLGALAYAAPEQLREGAFGPETDVYQFGVTLYVLACGRLPYELEDPDAFRRRLLAPDPHPHRVHHFRPEISARFEALIEGAREKDPARRWPLERVVEAMAEVYASKAFTLEQGPSATIAEELLDRVQANGAIKDYYRAVEALKLAGDFLDGLPSDKAGEARRRYETLRAQYEPYRAAVEAAMRVQRQHIAPVDRVMEELYRRYGRGEPLLTEEEKGILQESGPEVVVVRRSLFDWILQHTSAAIAELSAIDPELVGGMHRRLVDRASSQEVAASDLAARMVKFGEDYRRLPAG